MVCSFVGSAALREWICILSPENGTILGFEWLKGMERASGIPKNHSRVAAGLDNGFWGWGGPLPSLSLSLPHWACMSLRVA